MKKVDVSLPSSYRLLHPRLVVLVSCVDKAGKANVITLAWSMPVSINPPMVVMSIAPQRYSHLLIEDTEEFVINIPTMDIVQETLFCGRRSGRRHDKFRETQLTLLPAKTVKVPIIKECIAHLECRLQEQVSVGDHTLFIGRVLAAYADEGVFDRKFDVGKVKPIYHMGGDDFVTLFPETFSPQV